MFAFILNGWRTFLYIARENLFFPNVHQLLFDQLNSSSMLVGKIWQLYFLLKFILYIALWWLNIPMPLHSTHINTCRWYLTITEEEHKIAFLDTPLHLNRHSYVFICKSSYEVLVILFVCLEKYICIKLSLVSETSSRDVCRHPLDWLSRVLSKVEYRFTSSVSRGKSNIDCFKYG